VQQTNPAQQPTLRQESREVPQAPASAAGAPGASASGASVGRLSAMPPSPKPGLPSTMEELAEEVQPATQMSAAQNLARLMRRVCDTNAGP